MPEQQAGQSDSLRVRAASKGQRPKDRKRRGCAGQSHPKQCMHRDGERDRLAGHLAKRRPRRVLLAQAVDMLALGFDKPVVQSAQYRRGIVGRVLQRIPELTGIV